MLRTAASYASLGVTVWEAVTDDRPGYRSSAFAEAIGSIGTSHVFTRPHGLWQNGKAVRTDRTLAREWAYAWPYETNAERPTRPFSESWTTTIATGRTVPAGPPAHVTCKQRLGTQHLGCDAQALSVLKRAEPSQ